PAWQSTFSKGEMSRQDHLPAHSQGQHQHPGLQLRWQVCHLEFTGKDLGRRSKAAPSGVPSRIRWNQHRHQRAGGSRALLGIGSNILTTLANADGEERATHIQKTTYSAS
uniref:Integron gene cassette protein n=1 Tax=Macrostomum lignano TaxID=282301 RepID=A0A1I8IZH3_9PLAT